MVVRSQAVAEAESCSKLVRVVPFRHASCVVAEAPKARVAPSLVVRLFVSRSLRCCSSVCSPAMTASGTWQPQSAELVARSRGWACGPYSSATRLEKEDAHPRLRYWWFVELVHPRVFLVINAPEKKIQPPSSGAFSKGCLSRKLPWQCASPHLAPLALCSAPRFRHHARSSHHASSPPPNRERGREKMLRCEDWYEWHGIKTHFDHL